MTSRAIKLLDDMRLTKSGWGQKHFDTALKGHGFIRKGKRGKHNKYYHPEHKELWISIPRHNVCKPWVAVDVVKLIDELNKKK
ncbi:MAG: hypothetical protein HQ562_07885 [Candidatus Marinimicrobia bacterium]|nr:hypothetical protein [Candidatus Neomarinimicrobiota bacterium]